MKEKSKRYFMEMVEKRNFHFEFRAEKNEIHF